MKLQVKGFHPNQIKDYFFKPYNPETPITLVALKDMFEFNGFTDKKSELLARYLVEPRDGASMIEYDNERSQTQRKIIAELEECIGHYKVYGNAAETQTIIKRV